VAEVAYHAVSCGLVVNRGFLNGPICPIYGVGMMGVLGLLRLVTPPQAERPSLLLVFFGGAVLATGVELLGGWVLDQMFHTRWWDYSKKPFNFHGYICLQFSLLWGFAIVVVVAEIHPWIEKHMVQLIPVMVGTVLLTILYAGFLADLILTVIMLNRMNRHLAELEEIQSTMRIVSDKLTEVIAETSMTAAQKVGQGQVQAALGRAELKDTVMERYDEAQQELEQKKAQLQKRADELYASLMKHEFVGPWRILKAFPDLKSRDHAEMMEALRQTIKEYVSRKEA
jgi:uncharacterized membrane protein